MAHDGRETQQSSCAPRGPSSQSYPQLGLSCEHNVNPQVGLEAYIQRLWKYVTRSSKPKHAAHVDEELITCFDRFRLFEPGQLPAYKNSIEHKQVRKLGLRLFPVQLTHWLSTNGLPGAVEGSRGPTVD